MKYGPYKKEQPIGYAPGVFPSMELAKHAPQQWRGLLVHPEGLRNQGVKQLMDMARDRGIPVEEAPRALARIAGKDNCYAAAVFEKWDAPLMDGHRLVLVSPSDMGNLGSNLRTALGLGIRDVALIRPAADAFDPRAVRASMGALFAMRIAYYDDFDAYAQRENRPKYFFRLANALPLSQIVPDGRAADYVFGNEASGLPEELLGLETGVRIEQNGAVDSLNLSVAVGIGLYHFLQGGNIP